MLLNVKYNSKLPKDMFISLVFAGIVKAPNPNNWTPELGLGCSVLLCGNQSVIFLSISIGNLFCILSENIYKLLKNNAIKISESITIRIKSLFFKRTTKDMSSVSHCI